MLWMLSAALDRGTSGMSSASRYPEYQAHTDANMKKSAFRVPGDRPDRKVDAQARRHQQPRWILAHAPTRMRAPMAAGALKRNYSREVGDR